MDVHQFIFNAEKVLQKNNKKYFADMDMNKMNAKKILLQYFWDEKSMYPIRLLRGDDMPCDHPNVYWNLKAEQWHLWAEPRSPLWKTHEPGFVKPDFLFAKQNKVYIIELITCWYKECDPAVHVLLTRR